jgi:hypothetical protein
MRFNADGGFAAVGRGGTDQRMTDRESRARAARDFPR